MENGRKLAPAVATPLSIFHFELCRQRGFLLEAERRDDSNWVDPDFQVRHKYNFHRRRQVWTSLSVRLANQYRAGSKQIELIGLFREAVQSLRGDGTAGVILPMLEKAFEEHKKLVCAVADGQPASMCDDGHREATQRLQEYLPVEVPVDANATLESPRDISKIRPTPQTMEVIRAVQRYKKNDEVANETGCTADVARKVRSKLKAERYEI